MKTRIIRIGNSQGIRIPKPVLEQTGLRGEVEIKVEGNCLIINRPIHARAGWAEAFRAMAKNGDDAWVDGAEPASTEWEKKEWRW